VSKLWSVLFAVVNIACVALFAVAPAMGWWLPLNVSSFGGEIDNLFMFILWVTTFFFLLTEGLLVYAMWKYASEPGRKAAYVHGSHTLEVMWTLVPAVILVLIGFVQIKSWENIKYASRMPRPDRYTQQMAVEARQWEWRVRYPSPDRLLAWEKDGKKALDFGSTPHFDDVHVVNEIHVWRYQEGDRPQRVLIHLKTRDVLHSFFVPVLRLKQDALPGKTIPVWFMAMDYNAAPKPASDKPGEMQWVDGYNPHTDKWDQEDRVWDLACAEYCGTRHSMMKGRLFVHRDREDFLEWLRAAEKAQNAGKLPVAKN